MSGRKRQALTDGSGRWFYPSLAERYQESTTFDGSNHISDATGEQWAHQELYRTAGKSWILHSWSQWQGSTPSWEAITAEEAAAWLIRNGHEPPKSLADETSALEVE